MSAILGIDAAWTTGQPSGVSLVANTGAGWQCKAVAPSYQQFIDLGQGIPVNWAAQPAGGGLVVVDVLAAASILLAGAAVDVIAIDMPLATVPIVGRRQADSAISKTFGGRGCGTHTPNSNRPGPLGSGILMRAAAAGYPLATTMTPPGTVPAIIEVYPHPALLSLVGAQYRVPYKVSRSHKYWPGLPISARQTRLVRKWRAIRRVMTNSIGPTGLPLPSIAKAAGYSSARLKRFEDALDAVICSWVGIQYLQGHCTPYGDPTAAIWTP